MGASEAGWPEGVVVDGGDGAIEDAGGSAEAFEGESAGLWRIGGHGVVVYALFGKVKEILQGD